MIKLMNFSQNMVQHSQLFSTGFGLRQLMLDVMTILTTRVKGISLNLKDGREPAHPLHHLPILQVSKQH